MLHLGIDLDLTTQSGALFAYKSSGNIVISSLVGLNFFQQTIRFYADCPSAT